MTVISTEQLIVTVCVCADMMAAGRGGANMYGCQGPDQQRASDLAKHKRTHVLSTPAQGKLRFLGYGYFLNSDEIAFTNV